MATDQQKKLKQEFDAKLGPEAFHGGWSSLLDLDPSFFSASVSLAGVPRTKRALALKEQSLISLAVDCACTRLYAPGIREHVAAATRSGATRDEILEVVELSSTLGIRPCTVGVPLLVQVLRERAEEVGKMDMYDALLTKEFDENQERLKKEVERTRGYYHESSDDFLRLDPEFFEAYIAFSNVPWAKAVPRAGKQGQGALTPKMRELVCCAFIAASTPLDGPGLKLHMDNALGHGANPHEIIEVLELATLLSLHTAHVAAPIIEELTKPSSRQNSFS